MTPYKQTPARLGRASWLAAALALASCTEIPEVTYETERFEIAPDFDHEICAGTLAYFDEHLAYVEDSVGLSIPRGERVLMYWITEDLDDWCSRGARGCFYPGTRVIIGTSESFPHEMVHAVLNAEAQTSLFLEEGLAELYSGSGNLYRSKPEARARINEFVWLSREDYVRGELDYSLAGHFLAYIEAHYGEAAIRRLSDAVAVGASPAQLEKTLERATNTSFAELTHAYSVDKRRAFRGLRDEAVPGLIHAHAADVSLRCHQEQTFGPLPDGSPGMYRTMRLELAEANTIDIELFGSDQVSVELIDLRRERKAGLVIDMFHPKASGAYEHPVVSGGERASLELAAGTHLLLISQAGYGSNEATLVAAAHPPIPREGSGGPPPPQ